MNPRVSAPLGVPDWHFDVKPEDQSNAEAVQAHLSGLTGIKVGRAPAVRWAVAYVAGKLSRGEEL
jgi:hypothetical protein